MLSKKKMDRTHLRSGTDPVCMHRMRRQRLLRGRKQYLLHRTGKQDPSPDQQGGHGQRH